MTYEAGWKQVDARTFAVQSNLLLTTELGLLVAVRQIPRHLRLGVLRWQWKRQYHDERGRRWLEFHAI